MLNMNFSVPVLLNAGQLDWVPSPMPGVDRKPLAREDMERGHATSIVRYAPGSIFRPHPHPLGEEILVLSGEFCDEAGINVQRCNKLRRKIKRLTRLIEDKTQQLIEDIGNLP